MPAYCLKFMSTAPVFNWLGRSSHLCIQPENDVVRFEKQQHLIKLIDQERESLVLSEEGQETNAMRVMTNISLISSVARNLLVFVSILVLSGCSSVPPVLILDVSNTQSKIVMHDSKGYLRTFDPSTEKWSSRIPYPKLKYSSSHVSPYALKMFSFNDEVFIQIQQGGLYRYNDSEGLKFVTNTYGTMTGIDWNYYYFTAVITDVKKPNWFETKNYRVRRSDLKSIDGHFDKYQSLTVVDTKSFNHVIAYLCQDCIKYERKESNWDEEWQPYLLLMAEDHSFDDKLIITPSKFKNNVSNKVGWEKFVPSTGMGITFKTTEKFNSKICTYESGGLVCTNEFWSGRSTPGMKIRPINNVAWHLSLSTDNPRRLEAVNTLTGERMFFGTPNGVSIGTFSPQHLWNDSFWCSGYRHRNFVGNMPYLIRFSVPDGAARCYELEPGLLEQLETVMGNFFRYFNPVTYLGPG